MRYASTSNGHPSNERRIDLTESRPTQQTTWTEFTGSDDQIDEINNCENGYLLRYGNFNDSDIMEDIARPNYMMDVTHYWVIPDDPLREMKVRQARTGQPVYIREPVNDNYDGAKYITTTPDWNIPNAEYLFTEFKE